MTCYTEVHCPKYDSKEIKKAGFNTCGVQRAIFAEMSHAMLIPFQKGCDEAELDEQWSFVQNKSNQRWLGVAIDHAIGIVLAYVLEKRKDRVFKKLKVEFGVNIHDKLQI